MKIAFLAILMSITLSGCAPLLIGAAAGYVVADHHDRWWGYHYCRERCWYERHRAY